MPGKIYSYLGFALKSGGAIFGVDALERNKGRIYLIIFSYDISENSLKKALALKEKFSVPALVTEGVKLEDVIHKTNCKFIAIKDKNLSEAILAASENDREFKLYSMGGKLT